MRTIIAVVCLFFLLSPVTHAEIYKWVDEKGGVHFTEDPTTIPEKYRDKVRSRPSDEQIINQDGENKNKYPSIEKVAAFPEKYVGCKLVFFRCRINQELNKADSICHGCYSIPITSNGGKYVSPMVKQDGITFILLNTLAEKLAGDIKGGYEWPNCDVSCVILARGGIHIAVIYHIDVRNMGGKIVKTYIDESI